MRNSVIDYANGEQVVLHEGPRHQHLRQSWSRLREVLSLKSRLRSALGKRPANHEEYRAHAARCVDQYRVDDKVANMKDQHKQEDRLLSSFGLSRNKSIDVHSRINELNAEADELWAVVRPDLYTTRTN